MRVQINESFCAIALDAVRESLSQKLNKKSTSRDDQTMAGEGLGFLALQILIPMLVSLCSSALYDVLKGRILAKLGRKEAERAMRHLYGKTGDTSLCLSSECLEVLSVEMAPLGFSDSEITAMYERIWTVAHAGSTFEADDEQSTGRAQQSGPGDKK